MVIMPSLQRPRRIALRGSDGNEYLFMCKPKDDLRKDFRLMEFNDIVNKYLQNDPESRQRRLYIRTYVRFASDRVTGPITDNVRNTENPILSASLIRKLKFYF